MAKSMVHGASAALHARHPKRRAQPRPLPPIELVDLDDEDRVTSCTLGEQRYTFDPPLDDAAYALWRQARGLTGKPMWRLLWEAC